MRRWHRVECGGGAGNLPRKKINFCPQNDTFGCILLQSLTGRQDDTHLGLGTRILQFNREKITKPTKTVKIIQKFTVRPGGSHHRPLPNRPLLTTLLSARLQRSSAIVLFSAECVCLKTLLLSRRSRQRERLSASELSLWLSVCRQNAKKKRFSQKLSSLELWSLLTTYRKSYLGFSKNLLLDP